VSNSWVIELRLGVKKKKVLSRFHMQTYETHRHPKRIGILRLDLDGHSQPSIGGPIWLKSGEVFSIKVRNLK
jgi:hypothetical protein